MRYLVISDRADNSGTCYWTFKKASDAYKLYEDEAKRDSTLHAMLFKTELLKETDK